MIGIKSTPFECMSVLLSVRVKGLAFLYIFLPFLFFCYYMYVLLYVNSGCVFTLSYRLLVRLSICLLFVRLTEHILIIMPSKLLWTMIAFVFTINNFCLWHQPLYVCIHCEVINEIDYSIMPVVEEISLSQPIKDCKCSWCLKSPLIFLILKLSS